MRYYLIYEIDELSRINMQMYKINKLIWKHMFWHIVAKYNIIHNKHLIFLKDMLYYLYTS